MLGTHSVHAIHKPQCLTASASQAFSLTLPQSHPQSSVSSQPFPAGPDDGAASLSGASLSVPLTNRHTLSLSALSLSLNSTMTVPVTAPYPRSHDGGALLLGSQ
ncbi:hypothetical protein HN51_063207 [Arachis hypogaea]|nr:uncharacterized protein DS421_11g341130 [Arachis hypogaea]QHO20820.1 uncharacterized protein DS421_11g341300 [Arachis hypogaea]